MEAGQGIATLIIVHGSKSFVAEMAALIKATAMMNSANPIWGKGPMCLPIRWVIMAIPLPAKE